MDTITHGIVGALAGRAFFAGRDEPANFGSGGRPAAMSSATAKAAIAACTIGSIFPDIDIFAGPLARNPLAIMEWHRNITHSLVMLPVWALLLAAVSLPLARRLRWEAPPFAKLAGIYAVGLSSHVFLDVLTSFGTMTWSPLNYSRMAWDWLFIIDFTFSAIALAPQLAAWCYREPAKFARRAGITWIALSGGALGVYGFAAVSGFGFPAWVAGVASAKVAVLFFAPRIRGAGFRWKRASWSRVAMAALCAYLACAAWAHRSAMASTAKFAASQHLQVQSLGALPLPPTLTHWAGVVTTPDGVWRTTFRLPSGKLESTELYAAADSNRYVAEAKTLRDVQVYLWFARFPVWQVQRVRGNTVAEVTDVRFFRQNFQKWNDDLQSASPGAESRVNAPGFTFQIVFDAAGNIISHGFRRPE
ncbi:MAG: metal-dependent hydrolase [Acidobacteriia bacterium]|nr:metal-dependent hydrolase [Terriglobia bacterium]